MRRPEFIARQACRPIGWMGRAIARVMAIETKAANEAALDLLHLRRSDRVLEIGFGHGRTVMRAAQHVPDGRVIGVDHAETATRSARRRCAAFIASGRVQLHCADSARLPLPDAAVDKALAVHTLYFWQPPGPHLGEIHRVLVGGGRLVLAYRPAGSRAAGQFPHGVYAFHSPQAVEALLVAAGFSAIESHWHSPELVLTAAHRGLDSPLIPNPQGVTQ
jgi:ubiquinone/menaquinone biosynthesis C-methylase UbiE